jgi:hypothetical protein
MTCDQAQRFDVERRREANLRTPEGDPRPDRALLGGNAERSALLHPTQPKGAQQGHLRALAAPIAAVILPLRWRV